MATIQEIRQKYPQYSDLSDQELADSFHDKFYSDMPKDQFYNQLGLNKSKMSSLQAAAEGINTGVEDATGGLAQLLNLGTPKSRERASRERTARYEEAKESHPGLAKSANFLGSIAPSIPMLGLNPIAAGAAGGAMRYVPPGESRGVNTLVGASLGGIAKLAPPIYNAGRPSTLLGKNMTNEELQKALEVTRGTNTPLGDVVKSPFLKYNLENVLSKIPGSGFYSKMQENAKNITNKGHEILRDLLGENSPENVEKTLNDTLEEAFKKHRAIKNSHYNKVNMLADEAKLNLDLPGFSKSAKDYAKAIEDTNILKYEPQFSSLLNKLTNYKNPIKIKEGKIIDKEGNSISKEKISPSLKEANILSGHLDDLAERYSHSPMISERNASGVFKTLSRDLKNDIHSGIEKNGNTELKKEFIKAEMNYANNFSPFLDKEIFKYAKGGVDSDLILQHFIKTGSQTDRANLLENFITKLPSDKQNLLGYAYLRRAVDRNGELDPLKFKQLLDVKNLGNRQLQALFRDPKMRKEIMNYTDLIDKNKEAFDLMRNPKTGARLQENIPWGLAAAGYATGGLPGMAVGAVGIPLAANRITKALTSQSLREKLINKIIQRRGGLQGKGP